MEAAQDDRTQDAPEQSFAEMLAQSMAGSPRLEAGDKVEAKVLKIGADWVFLDVGQKGEGVLDIKELLDTEGRLTVSGGLMKVYDGTAMIADKADADIIPVRIDGLERSRFGYLSAQQTKKVWFPKTIVTILPPTKLYFKT